MLDPNGDRSPRSLSLAPPNFHQMDLRQREIVFLVTTVLSDPPRLVSAVTVNSLDSFMVEHNLTDDGEECRLFRAMDERLKFVRCIETARCVPDATCRIVVGGRYNGILATVDASTAALDVIDVDRFGAGATNAREIAVGDLDGDGCDEVVAAVARRDAPKWGSSPGALLVAKATAHGWTTEVIDDFEKRTHSRMVRVMMIDGRPAVVANAVGVLDEVDDRITTPSRMITYEHSDTGWRREPIAELPWTIKSRGFACGDVDGDGEEEIVVGTRALDLPGHGQTFLWVFKRDLATGKWRREEIARSDTTLGFHCVAAFDVDGDGVDEIIASEDARGIIGLHKLVDGHWRRTILASYPYRLFVTSIRSISSVDARK